MNASYSPSVPPLLLLTVCAIDLVLASPSVASAVTVTGPSFSARQVELTLKPAPSPHVDDVPGRAADGPNDVRIDAIGLTVTWTELIPLMETEAKPKTTESPATCR
jgi:hypothetical protein